MIKLKGSTMQENTPEMPKGEMQIYRSDDGKIELSVRMENESLWLTQADMAVLFDTTIPNISMHIKSIFDEGELNIEATLKKFLTVRTEGSRQVTRNLDFYNLDMIISVGYRVKSRIATQFRIWATARLREYIVKGFVMDDERLKNPPIAGSSVPDHFAEMIERIRDIRSSERRMYLRVREIFALAADYEPSIPETTKFFSSIQNKLHYAITHKTAAEIIKERANHQLPHMGLTSWKSGDVQKSDVTTAKNYLTAEEISGLNRIVSMWLDFAEDQATRRKQVFMREWSEKLDSFLEFNDRDVLTTAGSVTKKEADDHAKNEYEQFAAVRRVTRENQGMIDMIADLERAARDISERS